MSKYIVQHLGLGDHVILNGMVRTMMADKPDEKFYMFVFNWYMDTVGFMYRDLPNLELFGVNRWDERQYLVDRWGISPDNVINITYDEASGMDFDRYFYESMGYPFEYRWSRFHSERDTNRETDLFVKYGVEQGQYVFLHDDVSRGFEIDRDHIRRKDLPIVQPNLGMTSNAFDYCYLMEHSAESHFIDSSFRLIFDSFKLRKTEIYYHLNLRYGVIRNHVTKSGSYLPFTNI